MWQWNIFHISKSLLESFEWDEINYQVAIQMTILWPNKEKFIKDLNIKIFFFFELKLNMVGNMLFDIFD